MTGGDPAEIAKSASGKLPERVGVGICHYVLNQGIGEHMWQMAHRGQHLIMLGHTHVRDHRATGLPGGGDSRNHLGRILRERGKDHPALLVQTGKCGSSTTFFCSGHWMTGYELSNSMAEHTARRRHHIALGAAGIGEHGIGSQIRCELGKDGLHLPDRRRHQHKVGLRHRAHQICDLIDHAKGQRLGIVFGQATDTDYPTNRFGLAQRKRKRATDQTNPDNGNAGDQAWVSCRESRSAIRKRSFSCGNPMVIRR